MSAVDTVETVIAGALGGLATLLDLLGHSTVASELRLIATHIGLVRDVVHAVESHGEPATVVQAIKDSITAAADAEMARELGG